MAAVRRVLIAVEVFTGYQRRLVRGVIDYVRQNGLPWHFLFDHRPVAVERKFSEKVAPFHDADGVIFHGRLSDADAVAVLEQWSSRGVKVVVAGDRTTRWPCVTPDEVEVARLAYQHLRERGFPRLAYVGRSYFRGDVFERRREAFQTLAARDGLSVETASELAGDNALGSAAALAAWVRSLQKPVGVFAGNIDVARRVVLACAEAGVRVPSELAVIGVDPDDLFCELVQPPLSTIDHGMRTVGFEAARLLEELMSGGPVPPRPIVVRPVGVESRLSTDTLAVDDPIVRRVLELLQKRHTDATVRLEELLGTLPLARRTLELRFRRALGRSIHDHLTRLRVESARRLLLYRGGQGALKLIDVANRSGFSSAARLSEAFVRVTGQRPGQWRRRAGQASAEMPGVAGRVG